MQFSNISFKHKIFILLALPVIGFIWLGYASIAQSVATTSEMKTLSQLTNLSVIYSDLVHELQKERGMTAGFLSSKGAKFGSKLASQRLEADKRIKNKINYFKTNELNTKEVLRLNNSINARLNRIQSIRSQVDAMTISLSEALGFYTQINKELLSVSSLIASISSDSTITRETVAYYNFLQGKERAGIERAVLSSTFSQNQFAKGMFVKFVTLVTEQNTYFDSFNAFTNTDNQRMFVDQMNIAAVQEVLKLRKLAMTQSDGFNIDAEYWFSQASGRIGQLKKVEDELASKLQLLAQNKSDKASNTMIFNALSLVVLLMGALIICYFTLKDLSARVSDLTDVMSAVRDRNDLSVRTRFHGESELGHIASALNSTFEKFASVIDNLSSSSLTLASSAEETSQTCDHNLSSLNEQQDRVALIATAIEQLSATVNEVASKTQLTAESAKQVDEKAKGGLTLVNSSYMTIDALAGEIDGLAERIRQLHASSNKINNVVDVIKSLAEQTNLLALNAAIEAARAGEQGRGFAVVADEVRSLAQRTQTSTSEIESFIGALQSDVDSAFSVIDASQQKAAEAVDSSKTVENALQEITGSINEIFSMSEQMATAVEEQAVVTQDIASNVVSVEHKSTESVTAATEITTTAKDQAELAASLKDMASSFITVKS